MTAPDAPSRGYLVEITENDRDRDPVECDRVVRILQELVDADPLLHGMRVPVMFHLTHSSCAYPGEDWLQFSFGLPGTRRLDDNKLRALIGHEIGHHLHFHKHGRLPRVPVTQCEIENAREMELFCDAYAASVAGRKATVRWLRITYRLRRMPPRDMLYLLLMRFLPTDKYPSLRTRIRQARAVGREMSTSDQVRSRACQ